LVRTLKGPEKGGQKWEEGEGVLKKKEGGATGKNRKGQTVPKIRNKKKTGARQEESPRGRGTMSENQELGGKKMQRLTTLHVEKGHKGRRSELEEDVEKGGCHNEGKPIKKRVVIRPQEGKVWKVEKKRENRGQGGGGKKEQGGPSRDRKKVLESFKQPRERGGDASFHRKGGGREEAGQQGKKNPRESEPRISKIS